MASYQGEANSKLEESMGIGAVRQPVFRAGECVKWNETCRLKTPEMDGTGFRCTGQPPHGVQI